MIYSGAVGLSESQRRKLSNAVKEENRLKRDTEQLGKELAGQWEQTPRQRILDDPRTKQLQINAERCAHWLSVGAQPTERVEKLFGLAGIELPERMVIERGRKRAQGRAAYWCAVM